jgi:hypothetical protein
VPVLDRTRALYADLAKALGTDSLPPDNNGAIQLTIGEQTVILMGQDDITIMVVAPVAELPREPEYGTMLWLLRRNLYDSDIAPFTAACDAAGTVILWARIEIEGQTGETLAALLDAVAAEAALTFNELAGTELAGDEPETAIG